MDMIDPKVYWSSLYDNVVDKFMLEKDLQLRDLSMILQIMQIKFEEVKKVHKRIKDVNEQQAKEIEEFKTNKCHCKKNKSLEFMNETVNTSETFMNPEATVQDVTPVRVNFCNKSVELEFDDMFNQQISEIDLDMLQSANNSVVDETIHEENTEALLSKSPKLNKTKKHSRALKLKINKSLTPDETIISSQDDDITVICETPEANKSKKFKQSKLFLSSKFLEGSVLKKKSQSERNIIANSPKKIEKLVFRKPEKRLLNNDETMFQKASTSCEIDFDDSDEVDFDVILNDINKTECNKSQNCSQAKKMKTSIKENIDCSYDRVPFKNIIEPQYAYKGEAVRKRSEREALPGWDCQECERYYGQMKGLTTNEIRQRMNECSRHRSKHDPRTINTPPGYWNPDFTPSQNYNEIM